MNPSFKPIIGVIGNCYLDEIFSLPKLPHLDEKITAQDVNVTLGGSATNVASALVRLGSSVKLFSIIGRDYASKLLLQELQTRNIPTNDIQSIQGKTGKTVILLTPDGVSTKIGFPGVTNRLDDLLPYNDLTSPKTSIAHIHLASVTLKTLQNVLQNKRPDQTISVDVGSRLLESSKNNVLTALKHVNFIFANRQSFFSLFNREISLRALNETSLNTNMIITSGENGIYVKVNGKIFHQHAYPTKVIDTTGAGDMVAAYVLHEWITQEQTSFKDIIRGAAIAASLKIQTMGGANGQPTMKKIKAFLV